MKCGRLLERVVAAAYATVAVGGSRATRPMVTPSPLCRVCAGAAQVDQAAGERRSSDVLAVLAAQRRRAGRLCFGLLMQQVAQPHRPVTGEGQVAAAAGGCAAARQVLSVGDPVWLL